MAIEKIIKKASGVVAPSADWVTRLMKKVQKLLAKEKAARKKKKISKPKESAASLLVDYARRRNVPKRK